MSFASEAVRSKVERDDIFGCIRHRRREQSGRDPSPAKRRVHNDVFDVEAKSAKVSMWDEQRDTDDRAFATSKRKHGSVTQ
jgi:hypothetical protein